MTETRTVHDPFLGKDVQVSDRLVDRLRGRYASGPHLPNGDPEFGWRQFQAPPIQHEAAARIEYLEATEANEILRLKRALEQIAKEVFTDGTPTKAAKTALAALNGEVGGSCK